MYTAYPHAITEEIVDVEERRLDGADAAAGAVVAVPQTACAAVACAVVTVPTQPKSMQKKNNNVFQYI